MAYAFLTDDEHEAIKLAGKLAGLCRRIIGDGPNAEYDWAEMCGHIHVIQAALLAQAASRAYPHMYRPLGGIVDPAQVADA